MDLFYNNAWNKLIIFTTILLTIVGVVIPIIINWWQNRNLKLREKALKEDLKDFFNDELSKLKKEMETSIKEQFKEEIGKSKENQEEIKNSLQGTFFHLQANIEKQSHVEKMKSLVWSALCYIEGKDFLNLGGVLEMIENGLPKLYKEDIQEMDVDEANLKELLEELNKINDNSVYTVFIRKFKLELEKARNRAREPKLNFDNNSSTI